VLLDDDDNAVGADFLFAVATGVRLPPLGLGSFFSSVAWLPPVDGVVGAPAAPRGVVFLFGGPSGDGGCSEVALGLLSAVGRGLVPLADPGVLADWLAAAVMLTT